MVSSTAVAKILSQLAGVPGSKTESLALELRKSGVIKTKGPGRGGVDMELEEARDLIVALVGSTVPKDAPGVVKKVNAFVDSDGNTFGETFMKLFSAVPGEYVCIETIEISKTSNRATIIYSKGCLDDPHGGGIVSIPGYLHFSDPDTADEIRGYGVSGWISGGIVKAIFELLKSPRINKSELDELHKNAELEFEKLFKK